LGLFIEEITKIDGVPKGTNARLQKTAYKSFVFGTVHKVFFRVIRSDQGGQDTGEVFSTYGRDKKCTQNIKLENPKQ
jgi:hypothetical protein